MPFYKHTEDKNFIKLIHLVHKLTNGSTDEVMNNAKAILESKYEINYALPLDCQVQYFHPDWLGNTALHFAVQMKVDVAKLTLLLDYGADIVCKNHQGFTPLRLAYELYKSDKRITVSSNIINALLFAHIKSENEQNPSCLEGLTHLHIAYLSNNIEVVKFFLSKGVSVDTAAYQNSPRFPGDTLFHFAVYNRDIEMVKLLLFYGADYNRLNGFKKSALHILIHDLMLFCQIGVKSIKQSIVTAVETILDFILKKSFIDATTIKRVDPFNYHAHFFKIHNAFNYGMLRELIENGFDINTPLDFESQTMPGSTPLHFAARCNQRAIRWLIKNGANLLAKDAYGVTPLDLCIDRYEIKDISVILSDVEEFRDIELHGTKLLDLLPVFNSGYELQNYLSKGANVNESISSKSRLWPGYTILHLAVVFFKTPNDPMIETCFHHGADLSIKDISNMTALDLALRNSRWECVDEITENFMKYSPNGNKEVLTSVFLAACMADNYKIPQYLLSLKFDPNVTLSPHLQKFAKIRSARDVYLKVGSTPLHIAIQAYTYSTRLLEALFQYNANPHQTDIDGMSCLHRVFAKQPHNVLQSFLQSHQNIFNVNSIAPGGLSYFHVACLYNCIEAVKNLLPLTPDINTPITIELMSCFKKLAEFVYLGDTPLHLAVLARSEELVDFLLKNGANIKQKNESNFNPLESACMLSNRSVNPVPLGVILRLESEYAKRGYWPDSSGLTPLHVAAIVGDMNLMKQSLESGIDVNSRIKSFSPLWPNETSFSIMIKNHNYQRCKDVYHLLLNYIIFSENTPKPVRNETPYGLIERANILMPRYQNVIINSEGLTVFHKNCIDNNLDEVKKFIQAGIDIDVPTDFFAPDQAGYTPLHFAVEHSNTAVIEALLNGGANFRLQDSFGVSPVYLAASKRLDLFTIFLRLTEYNVEVKSMFDEKLIDTLFDKNDINFASLRNLLNLNMALNLDLRAQMCLVAKSVLKFCTDDVKIIINFIPNLLDVDEKGRNIIHYIVTRNDACVINFSEFVKNVKLLSSIGCDIDHQDENGKTPLHYALDLENKSNVKLLISLGVDINVLDNENNILRISNYRNWDLMEILLDHIVFFKVASLYLHPKIGDHMLEYLAIFSKHAESKENNPNAYYRTVTKIAEFLVHLKSDTQRSSSSLCDYQNILKCMNSVNIVDDITLGDILTEKLVLKFPILTQNQRQSIIDCIDSSDMLEDYPDWQPIFQYQLRRGLKRRKMLCPTINSLNTIVGLTMPRYCCECILIQLTTNDWQNILRACQS